MNKSFILLSKYKKGVEFMNKKGIGLYFILMPFLVLLINIAGLESIIIWDYFLLYGTLYIGCNLIMSK